MDNHSAKQECKFAGEALESAFCEMCYGPPALGESSHDDDAASELVRKFPRRLFLNFFLRRFIAQVQYVPPPTT